MDLTFETNEDFDSLQIYIAGIIGGIPIQFKMQSDDVCDYKAKCPIKKGEQNKIKLEFPIKSQYPKISLKVQVQLLTPKPDPSKPDQKGGTVLCVVFPAQIVY